MRSNHLSIVMPAQRPPAASRGGDPVFAGIHVFLAELQQAKRGWPGQAPWALTYGVRELSAPSPRSCGERVGVRGADFPHVQTRGEAPSPGICAKSAQIPTSPRKRGEVKLRGAYVALPRIGPDRRLEGEACVPREVYPGVLRYFGDEGVEQPPSHLPCVERCAI